MPASADWTTPADVEAQLRKLWDRGTILASRLAARLSEASEGAPLFPLPLRFRRPDARALGERWAEVRDWIRALDEGSRVHRGTGYAIEWEEIDHRQLGRNRVPRAIVVPAENDALFLLSRRRQAERFDALSTITLGEFPTLRSWFIENPLSVLDHDADWPRLLAVLRWFLAHPRSGLYLRQADIPGVDTKFIETRRKLVGELLDRVLSPDAIDPGATGAPAFQRRYGLRDKPVRVRFRILDEALSLSGLRDLATPWEEFARLRLPIERVFITENEINGLAFPDVPGGIVLFGLGYGVDRLAEIEWLGRRDIRYWGDIDTHGFGILDRLRASLPEAQSLLMDRETLLACREMWVEETDRLNVPLSRLTNEEGALYDDLRGDCLGQRVRLEQERIPFARLRDALRA